MAMRVRNLCRVREARVPHVSQTADMFWKIKAQADTHGKKRMGRVGHFRLFILSWVDMAGV
jgi:hypothetical protein